MCSRWDAKGAAPRGLELLGLKRETRASGEERSGAAPHPPPHPRDRGGGLGQQTGRGCWVSPNRERSRVRAGCDCVSGGHWPDGLGQGRKGGSQERTRRLRARTRDRILYGGKEQGVCGPE